MTSNEQLCYNHSMPVDTPSTLKAPRGITVAEAAAALRYSPATIRRMIAAGVPVVVHTVHGQAFHPYEKAWKNRRRSGCASTRLNGGTTRTQSARSPQRPIFQ